jgi:hypothetical protein
VAPITSRAKVIEIEPQVRPVGNPDLMVGMKMASASGERIAQVSRNGLNGWNSESCFPAQPDDIRLPAAIHASPEVALEAEHAQATVIPVIPSLCRSAAAQIMSALPSLPMRVTWTASGQLRATRFCAWVQDSPNCCHRA